MAPKTPFVYGFHASPAVRATLMTAKALGIPLDFKLIDIRKGDHKTPEFLKINPQHTVPVLDDDGFIISDSHAIITYLVRQYGSDDSELYPLDTKTRALIDQRLHFDGAVLFARMGAMVLALLYEGQKSISEELLAKTNEAYGFLEAFLGNATWFAGEKPTLADISLVANVSTMHVLAPIEESKFPNLTAWYERCKAQSWYEANIQGITDFSGMLKQLFGK